MATLTIRNLRDDVRDRIRVRAAAHGRSMEAEVRDVLSRAFGQEADASAVERQRKKIEAARHLIRPAIPEGTPLVDEFSGRASRQLGRGRLSGVLDASVILAVLNGEPGAEEGIALIVGGIISAVNLSEVVAKLQPERSFRRRDRRGHRCS